MSPEYVRPYVKAQKNDDRDAEAIAEAATRPTMRFVELKREDQLNLQTLHRARERLVGTRTRLINQMRAILLERGLAFAKGRRKFEIGLDALLDDADADLSERISDLLIDMRQEWAELDRRITELDREFADRAKSDEATRRLLTIPGIGNLTATALVAAIDDAAAFSIARDLPAWLGLVPRQHTTGGKPRLYGYQPKGQYLFAAVVHPRGTSCTANPFKGGYATGSLAPWSFGTRPLQRGSGCACSQACKDCMGDSATRHDI